MPPPSPIVLRGKVDYRALEAARSYDAILDAARGSIYAPTLLHLRPAPGAPLPDYTVCESLLRSAYFAHMLRIVRKQYGGDTRQVLLRSFGEQIDLLNLMHVLRLKTYFPGTAADTCLTMLYPFQYRLKPAMIHALCAAPDAAAVFALIRQTPYAASFERVEAAEVEEYYRRAFYAFNRALPAYRAPFDLHRHRLSGSEGTGTAGGGECDRIGEIRRALQRKSRPTGGAMTPAGGRSRKEMTPCPSYL